MISWVREEAVLTSRSNGGPSASRTHLSAFAERPVAAPAPGLEMEGDEGIEPS